MVTAYPSLSNNMNVDVAIIGAGISGALVAHYIAKEGRSVLVLDKRHAGMGSTAASTSLLQYEIDTPLHKLCRLVGEQRAVRSYRLCWEAIGELKELSAAIGMKQEFSTMPSLQYASYKTHVADLMQEYEMQLKHGFDVTWLSGADVRSLYHFDAPAALLSAVGGSLDAYLMTHALLRDVVASGHTLCNNTTVTDMVHKPRHVELETNTGYKVNAKKVVIACGYESLKYIPRQIAQLNSTYALVSEPVPADRLWHKNSLIWETKVPYIYARVTKDNRVIAGGYDDPFYNPQLRDSRINSKAAQIVNYFNRKFPFCPIRSDFQWAGVFATTKDGLPYIGAIPGRSNTFFALGFGGNGITFSVIAAKILADTIMGRRNKDLDIFSFNR